MNKYLIIFIVLILILAAGITFKKFSGKGEVQLTGETKEFTVYNRSSKWSFDPDTITVNEGDRVKLTIINEDNYDHGIAIEQFGVSQRIPANGSIVVDFIAKTAGEWPYYCSVSCGSGEVDGKPRGHFDQVGKLYVKSKEVTN